MNISLSPELERLIAEKVQSGRYHSADEVIRQGLELLQAQETVSQSEGASSSASVADIFASIANTVPDSEWAAVPTDLSKNLDRYLYGSRAKS
jgi:putative addiction module CopG family antidote